MKYVPLLYIIINKWKYISEVADITTFCPGAITVSQNVYTTYTFGAGSTIYNTFTGGVLNNTFAGDNTYYRSLNNLNTGEKYIVAIGPLGVIPASVSGLNYYLYINAYHWYLHHLHQYLLYYLLLWAVVV
jgi:hypothetical protein